MQKNDRPYCSYVPWQLWPGYTLLPPECPTWIQHSHDHDHADLEDVAWMCPLQVLSFPTNLTLDALLLLAVWQDNTQCWWIRCKLEVAGPSYHSSTHTPWPYLSTSFILLLRDTYYTIQPQKDRMWTSFSLELPPQWKWHRSLACKQTIIMHEFLPLHISAVCHML